MAYEVRLRPQAQKGLDALPERDYAAVATHVRSLIHNPRPPKVKKLAESGLWRIRVGRCRVVYAIDDSARVVMVVRVAKCNESTYRGT